MSLELGTRGSFPAFDRITNFFFLFQSREDTKQAIEIANAIADAIVSLKKVGDPPSVVRSKTIDILVYRSDPADISGKCISDRNSGVQLPSKDVLFGQNDSVPYVDFQVLITLSQFITSCNLLRIGTWLACIHQVLSARGRLLSTKEA